MLGSHVNSIIHTSCPKQIKPLEFHIVAKFANQRYTFNGRYKEVFLYFSLIFTLESHVTSKWTKICPKFTKSSKLYVASKLGNKTDCLFFGSSLVSMLASIGENFKSR